MHLLFKCCWQFSHHILPVDVITFRCFKNTDSSPTSSSALWHSVSLDCSKCWWVGDGGCNSLWFSILIHTLSFSVSPLSLLNVGPNRTYICQTDPGNSWTLGRASYTPIYIALTWQPNTSPSLSLWEMSQLYLWTSYQWDWNKCLITLNNSCPGQGFQVMFCKEQFNTFRVLVIYEVSAPNDLIEKWILCISASS